MWQRSSFISFVQKQRLSTQVTELYLKKQIILYIVFSFQENLCKELFCLFKVWKDLQPALPACIQPLSVCCVPLPVACAVELMPKGVIWMSVHWPSSFFVLAVTFSLCLCQNYALCWVLALVSQGRVALRHLLAAGAKCGAWQMLEQATERLGDKEWSRSADPLPLCPFLSLWSLTASKEQSLTFAFGFIQGKWILTVHFYYLFYNSSS